LEEGGVGGGGVRGRRWDFFINVKKILTSGLGFFPLTKKHDLIEFQANSE
jgi:hypothetical protein